MLSIVERQIVICADGYPTMILMIGTGHVFRIAESISFIIKNTWPEAILVELDERRYNVLTGNIPTNSKEVKNLPKTYKRSAKYQDRMSAKNDTQTGGELLAAVNTGNLIGADIICIDRDAEAVMREMEEEMSFMEKKRYSWSIFSDNLFGQRKIQKTQKDFSIDEAAYIENMRRRYPTFVRKLIDERNVHMAEKIRDSSKKYESLVIVVGDAHVEGICALLGDLDIKKIRLSELLDESSLSRIKSEVWNNEVKDGGM